MSRKHSKHIRKPMPKPTEAHKSNAEKVFETYSKEQVAEAIDNWRTHNPDKYSQNGEDLGHGFRDWNPHPDPADEGWGWGPPDKSGNLWEIK